MEQVALVFVFSGVDARGLVGKPAQGLLDSFGVRVRVRLKPYIGSARDDISFVIGRTMTKRRFVDARVVDENASRRKEAEDDAEVAEEFCHGGFCIL